MQSSLLSPPIVTFICTQIYLTISQPTSSPTKPTTSSTTTSATNNEITHLYIIIGVLSGIIVLMLCAAAFYFFHKHKKDKENEILFGLKKINSSMSNPDPDSATSPKKGYESPPVTPTPNLNANNNTNPNANNNQTNMQTGQTQIVYQQNNDGYPQTPPQTYVNNNYSQTNTVPANQQQNTNSKPAEKKANDATKNLISLLNQTVSQRNLAEPAPTDAKNSDVTSPQSIKQSIYLQEQRLAFSKMKLASSPNLMPQNPNPSVNSTPAQTAPEQKVIAPPKMNRAMFFSQQNLTQQTAQHRMMQAAQFQSVRNLPSQNNYQQQQAQFAHMKMGSSPHFAMQNNMHNVQQINYQQQMQANYYNRQRAMTTPQNYNAYPQNVQPQQMNMAYQNQPQQIGNEQNENDEESVSIRTESEDVEMGKVGRDKGVNY